jgi:hypothetical protein
MVSVLAGLGHDVVQLWELRGGGSLRLRAAHPREGILLEIARPRDLPVLARALEGELVRSNDPASRSWLARTTKEILVAPLEGPRAVAGVLVLGRWRDRYTSDDELLARACAQFISGAFFAAPDAGRLESRVDARAESSPAEQERETELTGS